MVGQKYFKGKQTYDWGAKYTKHNKIIKIQKTLGEQDCSQGGFAHSPPLVVGLALKSPKVIAFLNACLTI